MNQTFNSIVNYTNRSGDQIFTTKLVLSGMMAGLILWLHGEYLLCSFLLLNRQIVVPYLAATGAATVTALTLNQVVAKVNPILILKAAIPNTVDTNALLLQRAPPLIGRFVPFAAVAAANAINIPLMRQRELRNGVPIFDEQNNRLGLSTVSMVQYLLLSCEVWCVFVLLRGQLRKG